jgi:hypothetical protein
MPETCRDICDNKSQLLHQVGTSRHYHFLRGLTGIYYNDVPKLLLKSAEIQVQNGTRPFPFTISRFSFKHFSENRNK